MTNIDTRLTEACNKISEVAQKLNDSILSLNAVVNDYISADQEREDKVRDLEEEQRSDQDEKLERSLGG